MSLVQQCLENLGTYSGYALSAEDAAKYTMDNGAVIINMESVIALNEVFDAEYAVEEAMLQAVVAAKHDGVPVEERMTIGSIGATIKEKVSKAWTKTKDWFKKMKDKVKSWYENLKKTFRAMFWKPMDFVKTYRSVIESVDGSAIAANVRIYKFTNIDGYDSILTNVQTTITDKLMRYAEEGISRYGKEFDDQDNPDNPDAQESSIKMSNAKDDVIRSLEKNFGKSEDRAKKLFAYFRNGASSEDDKMIPSNLNMKEWTAYVLDMEKQVNAISAQQKAVDNVYGKFIKKVEEWQNKYEFKGGMNQILSLFTSSAATIQSTCNDATNAYIAAVKERASTGYQLCRKAFLYKNKKDAKENK